MNQWIIIALLWSCFSGGAFSQISRSNELYGEKGLLVTEAILTELDLPEWLWGGAHTYENVERNFRLVDGNLLETYFGKLPASGLNDPQHFLNDEQREKIEVLISAHDMKSAMPLYVNVLAHGQKLALSVDEVKARLGVMFRDKNAMVIFYYYGYARGVKGYVLLDTAGFIEDWEVDELFLRSAQDASVQVENFLELESFIREFSKRSFWLEQRLITPVQAVQGDGSAEDTGKQKSVRTSDQWLLLLTDHTLTLVLALWALAAGAWYFLWSRKWKKYVLPDGNVPVRLGASFGANVSNTVEFSDAKISLTEQYKKTKNRELL